jgi:hypothetical protein
VMIREFAFILILHKAHHCLVANRIESIV